MTLSLPDWVDEVVDWERAYETDEDKMRLAIALSRENVRRGTGGPFGAAIAERDSGRLVAVGVNSVVRLNNCTLHAEMVAFQLAQARLGSFTLGAPEMPVHVLATFGPFTRAELAAWSRHAASVDRARGQIRPVPLGDAPERFARLELGAPLVVINEGTEPSLGAALLFSGFMLGFGGLAGYLLLGAVRDIWRRPPTARA